MINAQLKYILPAILGLYFIMLFLIRSVLVAKKIGKSPVVLTKADDAHGLIGQYFGLWMFLTLIYVAVFALYPKGYNWFLPMNYLENKTVQVFGLALLVASLVFTYVAQGEMRNSWRIGIDERQKTELVTSGIFRFSRNPIYLGMMISILGLFLVTPNALTLFFAVLGYVLIQVQVRLEEEFLSKLHGQSYLDYKMRVRRFI